MKKERKGRYPKATVEFSEFTEDFESKADGIELGRSYKYLDAGRLHRFISFLAHNVIAPPIAYFYSRLILRDKLIGKKKLEGHKSLIMYCNHTEPVGDALAPHTFVFPKRAYTVVHPDNLALPVLGKLIPYLGAIPTPTDLTTSRRFSKCLEQCFSDGAAVVIFPEAHVWKKYTGIRPMDDGAFSFPGKYGVPAFAVTRVYRRARLVGTRCHIYIDGPFFEDLSLPRGEARMKLKEEIIEQMKERAALSNVEIIRYVRKEN
ncbi:MAG: 1-acyl-sn-glycerol-3-phosphate acyltransferase [Clostridia bacterium]|nr:1-acyl-sn-glycerol-3-phosphate acyltransferase [Clostridia bacterium]